MKRPGYGLFALAAAPLLVAVVLSVGNAEPSAPATRSSHDVYEQGRIMTEQMRIDVGPGMQSVMTTDHMLHRSADESYLRALERHACEVDRMLARSAGPCP